MTKFTLCYRAPEQNGFHFSDGFNLIITYSHLSNNPGGWTKRGGGAKVAKSLNVEVGINVEGGIFWKKTST